MLWGVAVSALRWCAGWSQGKTFYQQSATAQDATGAKKAESKKITIWLTHATPYARLSPVNEITNNRETKMKTYRNKNFKARNYECTNVAACKAETNPDESKWVEDCDAVKPFMVPLWRENGVQFWGWL